MGTFFFNLTLVATGSAVGGISRHWVSTGIHNRLGIHFPWGTLVVNVSGAVLMGIAAGLIDQGLASWLHVEARLLLILGLCGGYTTVSSFALQTWSLSQENRWWAATLNAVASSALCVAAVWAGLAVTGVSLSAAGV